MLNQRDVTPLKQFWTSDTVERFPDRACRGPQEIARYLEDTLAAIGESKLEIVATAEQGEDVFVQWRLSGIHEGPLLGVGPTGRRVAIDGMSHFVIRDGVVVSNFVVFDQMQYARQIGLMPANGSPADRTLKAAFNAWTRLVAAVRRRRYE
jgi:predicted ester cyclase